MKLKSINLSNVLIILKCCLIGIVATLIGIVAFAVVLKFADLNNTVVSWVNDIIKGASIFLVVFFLKRKFENGLLVKSIIAGVIYGLLTFIIFSILNGGFAFNMSIVYDLLFAVIVSAIAAVILNLVKKN